MTLSVLESPCCAIDRATHPARPGVIVAPTIVVFSSPAAGNEYSQSIERRQLNYAATDRPRGRGLNVIIARLCWAEHLSLDVPSVSSDWRLSRSPVGIRPRALGGGWKKTRVCARDTLTLDVQRPVDNTAVNISVTSRQLRLRRRSSRTYRNIRRRDSSISGDRWWPSLLLSTLFLCPV